MADRKSASRGILASVVFLLSGMTIGFVLLGIVWEGSAFIKVLVGAVYLFIVFMVVRSTGRVISAIKAEENGNGRVQKP